MTPDNEISSAEMQAGGSLPSSSVTVSERPVASSSSGNDASTRKTGCRIALWPTGPGGDQDPQPGAKEAFAPVFLLNPDGTLMRGVPPGHKEWSPPTTPRQPLEDDSFILADLESSVLATHAEWERAHDRHARFFQALLLLGFVAEVAFMAMFCFYSKRFIEESASAFPKDCRWALFWVLVVCETLYMLTYYGLGGLAVWLRTRRRLYGAFAAVALAGIFGQLLLAYVDRFNLFILSHRMMSYIYAKKFLRRVSALETVTRRRW